MYSNQKFCSYALSFLYFHNLVDATGISANYLKVQAPFSTMPVSVNFVEVTSLVQCGLECHSRSCLCFSYDAQLQECGIGNCLKSNSSKSASKEFYVSCNSNEGFQLVTSGSNTASACVWVSTNRVIHDTARDDCIARSTHLYSAKTFDKLEILRQLNLPNQSWIGLNDLAVEDTFRWEEDDTICDATCRQQIFTSGDPNNGGNEDCTMYLLGWIIDIDCVSFDAYYICEKNLY